MNLDTILKDLVESLPEIYDGFVFEVGQGVVAHHLNLLKDEDCLDIFHKVEKVFAMVSAHYTDIATLKFCYGSTVLLAYPIQDGRWLFLTHSDKAVTALVDMNVMVALKALGQPGEDVTPAPTAAPAEPVIDAEHAAATDVDSLIAPGSELHGVVDNIEKVLIKIVGPIGEIMLEDALLVWVEKGKPSLENINHLLDLLEIELDDSELYHNFQKLLGSV